MASGGRTRSAAWLLQARKPGAANAVPVPGACGQGGEVIERKPVEQAAPDPVAVSAPAPKPEEPVAVQPLQAAAVEPVPPKEPPATVEVKPPAQGNEQQHFFE
jgi:hypothetical protein